MGLSIAIYVYLALVTLYCFRLSFNYTKWVFPRMELKAPHQSAAVRHKVALVFIGLTMARILVSSVSYKRMASLERQVWPFGRRKGDSRRVAPTKTDIDDVLTAVVTTDYCHICGLVAKRTVYSVGDALTKV